MDAYAVLRVLNDLEPVDLDRLEFGVITAGYTETVGTGRMQGQIVTLPEEAFWPFHRGEVLVLDKDSGREPFGEMRKPGKWDVKCERVATLAEAVEIRNAVLSRTDPTRED